VTGHQADLFAWSVQALQAHSFGDLSASRRQEAQPGPAADDDALGVEQVDQVGQTEAEKLNSLVGYTASRAVPLIGA
jgi:hypothetical protein